MPKLTRTEMHAWRGFLDTHAALLKALDTDLAADGLNLPAYELLLTLQEAGADGMRMTDLAHALRFSGGGLTRLADRLERQGYMERRRCAIDGRGLEAVLTKVGAGKLKRVHVKHLAQVRVRFLDRLTSHEVETLAGIWRKFPEAAQSSAAVEPPDGALTTAVPTQPRASADTPTEELNR